MTFAWTGKKPGRLVKPLDADSRDDAVLCVCKLVVWSHARERLKKFPRYETFLIEERVGTEWVTVREGTYADATTEFTEKDTAETLFGAAQSLQLTRRKAGFAPRINQGPRRNGGTSRLAALVNKVLADR